MVDSRDSLAELHFPHFVKSSDTQIIA